MMILQANKRYPRQALLQGIEGDVSFTFIVNSQGTVLSYTIVQSSGSAILDDEVKRLLHAVRFPPFPQGDTAQRKDLSAVLDFNLKNSGG